MRAGDRNASLFVGLVRFCGQLEREAFDEMDIAFVEGKIANSPVGVAYRGGYTWVLAGRGETARARNELHEVMALPHAFDANWLSLQAECAEASTLVGDATHAATLYERLLPYAGRPVTAGRSVCSYGAADRLLGGLAHLLERRDDAVRHLHDAIRVNAALGCSVMVTRPKLSGADTEPESNVCAGTAPTVNSLMSNTLSATDKSPSSKLRTPPIAS